ncbi:hypothetical protein NL676_003165 [Syzygium grande]|nr:hypothetical protein NL676_003165 [Syzygium grande]
MRVMLLDPLQQRQVMNHLKLLDTLQLKILQVMLHSDSAPGLNCAEVGCAAVGCAENGFAEVELLNFRCAKAPDPLHLC